MEGHVRDQSLATARCHWVMIRIGEAINNLINITSSNIEVNSKEIVTVNKTTYQGVLSPLTSE